MDCRRQAKRWEQNHSKGCLELELQKRFSCCCRCHQKQGGKGERLPSPSHSPTSLSVFSGQTYHAREMQFSRKQSRVAEGLGTDLRTKGELIDEPNNHILLKVVSSWRTGTTSSFPVYTHHQFSTTSKMFNVYVLSESACNLGCIRHLEGSNQILSATCLWSP